MGVSDITIKGDSSHPVHTTIDGPIHAAIDGPIHTVIDGPITASVAITAIPVLHFAIDSLPVIQLGDVNLNMRIKEFPSIRGHLPANFCVGLSVLGMELMNVRLCGEAQIITEPYVPNPCEVCGPPGFARDQLQGAVVDVVAGGK
jgi:hypothetical protein